MEELYRERAVIRSSNRTRVDRKTNRLSLALSLSPPTYNNSSSKNNNIRPVSRSLLVLDTRPSANDGISVAAVAACYVNTHGEKYDVSKKFAREWPIHAEQVEIEEVSSILPRSLSRNLCEFQRLSSGEIDGERRKVVLRIVKKFLATRYHHFLLIFALILSTFHASFLRSPSSQRHRRSWRPRSEARKKDIFFSRMLGTSDRSVDGSAF